MGEISNADSRNVDMSLPTELLQLYLGRLLCMVVIESVRGKLNLLS